MNHKNPIKTWKLSVITTPQVQFQIQECFDKQSPGMANRCEIPFGDLVATTWVFYGATDEKIAQAKEATFKLLYHTSLHTGLLPNVEFVRCTESPDKL